MKAAKRRKNESAKDWEIMETMAECEAGRQDAWKRVGEIFDCRSVDEISNLAMAVGAGVAPIPEAWARTLCSLSLLELAHRKRQVEIERGN